MKKSWGLIILLCCCCIGMFFSLSFQEKELIIQVAADSDGHMRYDYYQKPHYHVICVRCNKIIDVFHDGFQAVEQDAAQATGFKVYNSQCEVYGLCPDCQAELAK